jgi:VWFA-related protein
MPRFKRSAVLALLAPSAFAQQQPTPSPPPRFREAVTVERLVVDVRVVDDLGGAVLGLRPEDFRVKVDGKSVAVESASWVGPNQDEDVVVTPDGSPPPREAGALAPEPRLIVFLFQKDLERSRIGGLQTMLRKLDSLLAALGPGDLAAGLVYDSHLRLVHDFSADHARLRRALEQDLFRGKVAVQEGAEPSLYAHLDAHDAKRAASPEKALRVIGEALVALPGAKTLVFFGWGLGEFSRMGVHMRADYGPAKSVLQRARCSVFSLDITDADYHSLEAGLEQVALDTGGFYAKTHLFPDQALKRMERALQGYYVLSFERPEGGKPGAQRLDVSLNGKKGTVLAPSAVG